MTLYLFFRALHIISFVAWFAALFYLPRLYVYHSRTQPQSESSALFKIMEYKLNKIIMTPAMVCTWVGGLGMIYELGGAWFISTHWFHAKFALLLILMGFHGMLSHYRKSFARDERPHSEKFFRIFNEVPTFILILIVGLAVFKPF